MDGPWRGELDAELEENKSSRGVASVRVEWNVTGTVLSTVSLIYFGRNDEVADLSPRSCSGWR